MESPDEWPPDPPKTPNQFEFGVPGVSGCHALPVTEDQRLARSALLDEG
jgi:hypothetical protein